MPERAAEAFGVRTPFEMPQPAENLSRLVQSIRVQSRDGVSQASVRLNPEHLGEVTVTVRVEGSSVTAIVRAESADVRQWLRGQEESIRASLAGQGLDLDDLVVDRDPSGQREPQEQPQAPPWQVSQRRRHGPEPRFEVSA
jgi:flagellar hook-length control protein FliK